MVWHTTVHFSPFSQDRACSITKSIQKRSPIGSSEFNRTQINQTTTHHWLHQDPDMKPSDTDCWNDILYDRGTPIPLNHSKSIQQRSNGQTTTILRRSDLPQKQYLWFSSLSMSLLFISIKLNNWQVYPNNSPSSWNHSTTVWLERFRMLYRLSYFRNHSLDFPIVVDHRPWRLTATQLFDWWYLKFYFQRHDRMAILR